MPSAAPAYMDNDSALHARTRARFHSYLVIPDSIYPRPPLAAPHAYTAALEAALLLRSKYSPLTARSAAPAPACTVGGNSCTSGALRSPGRIAILLSPCSRAHVRRDEYAAAVFVHLGLCGYEGVMYSGRGGRWRQLRVVLVWCCGSPRITAGSRSKYSGNFLRGEMGLSAVEWDSRVCLFDDPRCREIRVTPADVFPCCLGLAQSHFDGAESHSGVL
ncbi:hypothetical protein GGX14DRAFT_384095 [Mycena pura]|uniref:Uncharacterized protein n=1 Tax=Mycena pura TaxID=153505 RepID=A0AAD7E5I0_9AGAR|nr:hypothetical protein GGX14DRAFT_384095 [Mycena pura]